MTNKTELLPCPFCGGQAKVSSFPGAHNVWCENKPARCGSRSMFTFEQWNRRAALVEDVRAVVDGPQQKNLLPARVALPHPPRHTGFMQPGREIPGYNIEQMKEYGAQCVAEALRQNK